MRSPTNQDEFLDLLDQAIFGTNDLLASAEEGEEDADFSTYLPTYEQLYRELRALHDEVREGRHAFGAGTDLAVMPLVRKWKARIPFNDMIEVLNRAHLSGF